MWRAPRFVGALAATLRDPALARLEIAFVAFNAAEWATWIAILVYAYEQGGAVATGVVAVLQLVPAALFAPFGAALGERYSRGRVLPLAYATQAVTMGATAAALLLGAPAPVVYAFAATAATSITLTRPLQSSLLPSLVATPEALTAANAALGTIENASILVAPALAGVLLALAGPGVVYATMAAALALGAMVVWGVRPTLTAAPLSAASFLGDSLRAFGVLAADPRQRTLVALLAGQAVQVGALDVLFVVLALGVLDTGDTGVGLLNAALGLGGVAGAIWAGTLAGRRSLSPWLVAGILIWGGGLALVASLPSAAAVLALIVGAGAGRSLMDIAGRTLLQRIALGDVLARVFGVLEGLSMAALALGAALAPVLVETVGVPAALLAVAAILPLILAATWRGLVRIDAEASVPTRELALLRAIPIFAPLPPRSLERIAVALERLEARSGTLIAREGEPGDRFYVIDDGAVDVLIAGTVVRHLGRGDSFGEIALLRNVARTATVRAAGDVRLYALGRADFIAAITSHPASMHAAEAAARSRGA